MERKKLLLLVGAMVIALCNALIARSLLSGHASPSAQAMEAAPRGPRVLVAQRALGVGTILTPDAVISVEWPRSLTGESYFLEPAASPTRLAGMVARVAIPAGAPLTRGALVAPGDRGFLAAALGPGQRAVTIPVTERSGVGGFVFPGDRVDLMLTQTMRGGPSASDQPLSVTETILHNLRVLATDQSTGSESLNGQTLVKPTHSVTLEVTPRNAEKIEVAQSMGTLSLALRALVDAPSAIGANIDRALASGAVSIPANASRQEEERLLARAASGADDDAPSFSTGGDVSRFQRRGLSAMPPAAFSGGPSQPQPASPAHYRPAPALDGPVVNVSRGKDVTAVAVGRP